MFRPAWLPLGAACLASLACGSRNQPISSATGLSHLPSAGDGPLTTLVPEGARFAAAFRDARASWLALRASPLSAALERSGAFDDLPSLPLVERWEALQGRLAELARLPLPPLSDLLAGPTVVAWVAGERDAPAGWIWVERLGPESRAALAFARVLAAIHTSASEVEVELHRGVLLRRVRLGSGEVSCFVIADRLVLGTSFAAVARSLDLALGSPRTRPIAFPSLEATAQREGFAAEVLPSSESGPAALPGVRHFGITGTTLSADLDPALWAAPERSLPAASNEIVRLELSGLDLGRAWASMRPRLEAGSPEERIAADVDQLAATLGRGAFLSIARTPAGGLAFRVLLATKADPSDATKRLLADAIKGGYDGEPRELPRGGELLCPWEGDDGPACLAVCPTELSLEAGASLLSAGACEVLAPVEPATPTAALRLSDADGTPLFRSELRAIAGGFGGTWTSGGAQ